MLRFRIIPVAAIAAMALATSSVSRAETVDTEHSREVARVLNAHTSLSEAIGAAEKETGGRALKIGYEKDNGAYVYEIKTFKNKKIIEILIDPVSGKVIKHKAEGLIAKIREWDDQDAYAKVAASPITLATAIRTAEKSVGGKAVEAGIEDEDDGGMYKIEVAKDAFVHDVVIDIVSRKIVSERIGGADKD